MQQERKAYDRQGQQLGLQTALGQLGTNNPWHQGITTTAGTTGSAGFTSPITYTTSTNTASNSYSTTGAIFNKQ